MKLLYFKEHLSCINYQINVNTGFVSYNLEKDSVSKIDNSKLLLVFFSFFDGEVSIDSGEYQNVHIEKDKMVLIPQHVDNKIEVTYDAKCLLLFWNKDIRVCDKVYMNSLSSYKERKKRCVLPIRDPLQAVLNSIVAYLYAKMQCKHMHLIQTTRGLLVLRRILYEERIVIFFSSILGNTGHFRRFCNE